MSEDEFDFDEVVAVADDEDDSSDEFQASDDDDDDDEDFEEGLPRKSPRGRTHMRVTEGDCVDDSDDADAIMLDAVVQLSKAEAAKRSLLVGEAGPSTQFEDGSANSAIALHAAAAAERRLAKENALAGGNVLPEDNENHGLDEQLESALSSDDEPLIGKGKGTAKSKSKGKGKATEAKKALTKAELRSIRREQRWARLESRKEELALIKQLGRRLTYVR